MKVLIADDHPLTRRGARELLVETFPKAIIGEVANADELFNTVRTERWDLVILDLSMPGTSGLEGLIEMKRLYPDLPVLVLSMHSEEEFAVRAFKFGAAGYLTKQYASDELPKAVKSVLDEGQYVSANFAKRLAASLSDESLNPPHEKLSAREYRVMCLLASGETVSDVAGKLHLSVKTVSTYRTRILEKMNMKNNVELTRYCVRKRLID